MKRKKFKKKIEIFVFCFASFFETHHLICNLKSSIMSGRGKGKSSKKAVSRSAKAGLQFPVGRIARYAFFYVSFFFKPHTVWDSFVFLLIIFKKK